MKDAIKWLDAPETKDYPAALSYLSLHFDVKTARSMAACLMEQPLTMFAAKDIIRASGLRLLDDSNYHVAHNLSKIAHEQPLSPILLVRGQPLIVADGYHRVCSVYAIDEDIMVPGQIVNFDCAW
jgi:hypothetical protein